MTALLAAVAVKSALLSAITLLVLQAIRRRSAAERSLIAHAGLVSLLLVAAAPLLLPRWNVTTPQWAEPAVAAGRIAEVASIPPSQATARSARPVEAMPATQPRIDPATAVTAVYAAIVAALFASTLIALVRLVRLKSRASKVVDRHWSEAMDRARQRMRIGVIPRLMESGEIGSPISWGLARPVILLDPSAFAARAQADAILVHELAHIARFDWAKLMIGRLVTAIFWFNPLVWMLAREAHQLREESADDAVLAARFTDTDYAALLVGVARHDSPRVLAAHGVAPSRGSLARRIRRVLDCRLARGPAARPFTVSVGTVGAALAIPIAALSLVGGPVDPLIAASASRIAVIDANDHRAIMRTADVSDDAAQPQSTAVLESDGKIDADPTLPDHQADAMRQAAATLARASDDELFGLRAVGVTAEYMRGLAAAGYGEEDLDDIQSARAVGVDGAYAGAVRAAGIHASLDDVISMRAVGVPASQMARLARSAGNDPDDVTTAWLVGGSGHPANRRSHPFDQGTRPPPAPPAWPPVPAPPGSLVDDATPTEE